MACLLVVACDNTDPLEDLGGTSAAFASWVSAPSGDLLTSDPSSSISWEFELVDGTGGNDVASVEIRVSDGTNSGTLATITSFSENDNGLQGASGSFDLSDIAGALGVGVGTIGEGDDLDFSLAVEKSDGSVWGQANAGASSGYDPANPFTLTVATETVSLASSSVDSTYLNANSVDTVFLEFANDFTAVLTTNPTIVEITEQGSTGVIGAIQTIADSDGADSVYWFTYTPDATATTDTVSFQISAAEAVAGFTMVTDTFKMAYFIDDVNPTVAENNSRLVRAGASLDTTGYDFNYIFNEDIGSLTLMEDFVGVDDDGDGDIDGADADGDAVAIATSADGDTWEFFYEWTGSADGEVNLTIMVKDLAGNPLDLGTVNLTP